MSARPVSRAIGIETVRQVFGRHSALYRCRAPHYQAALLGALSGLWQGRHDRVLDVGGGTGVMAQAVSELLAVTHVTTIDVADRFAPGLTVDRVVYDGRRIPFASECFDAATLLNVLHHVSPADRVPLLREIARVCPGPLYIKDHVSGGRLDNLRLAGLDVIGNMPFGGMVTADYISGPEWSDLAAASGYRIAASLRGGYRSGLHAALCPDRLEIIMRWERS